MSVKRAVVTFDEERFTVYGEDKLLISVPSAVVRKKSAAPVAVAFGKEALLLRDELPEGTMFCRPFKGNTVADLPAVKLTIRHYFKKLFGFSTSVEIYILISSGISSISRAKIEQAFISCGYKNIYIVERPYVLAMIAKKTGFDLVACIEKRTTEVVLSNDGKIVQAHSINVGFRNISEDISAELCAKNELSPCIRPTERQGETSFVLNTYAEVPVMNFCSLSPLSYLPITAIGQDVISGENKAVTVTAKDLFPYVSFPYEKTAELIWAVLLECKDDEIIDRIAEKGILYVGTPTGINYFSEYMYKKIKQLPVHVESDPYYQVKALYSFLDDKSFLDYCLGFHS